MELTGKIKLITDEQKFDSGFYKKEFVISTQEQYPQDIKFEVFKEKCEMLNGLSAGSDVKVHFDIRGREWQGKYFNNLVAWKIEGATVTAAAPPAGPTDFPQADPVDVSADDEDGLPF